MEISAFWWVITTIIVFFVGWKLGYGDKKKREKSENNAENGNETKK